MKQIATMALLLNIGAAGVYAQGKSVILALSGTTGASASNLQAGSSTGEDNFAGAGTLGLFTLRNLRAVSNTPSTSPTCSGANQIFFTEPVGAGVFRFLDGSLLTLQLTAGGDCIDLTTGVAHCTVTFQIAGGTGRFKNASGTLNFTETVTALLFDASNNFAFGEATGELTGTISGLAQDQEEGQSQAQ
jgi:hypothetical protein